MEIAGEGERERVLRLSESCQGSANFITVEVGFRTLLLGDGQKVGLTGGIGDGFDSQSSHASEATRLLEGRQKKSECGGANVKVGTMGAE